MKKINTILFNFLILTIHSFYAQENTDNVRNFLNLKFGMFIHYNMGTYHAEQWAYPFHDPKDFQPSELDCSQWAKTAKAAGMKYGVFTTKHHDGFSLWDTKVSNYDIASAKEEYKNIDIVKEYVNAFRKEGLAVGLYFSVWDRHHGVEHGNINKENIEFTKAQLTELLTNYGKINCIVIDGWGSRWGKGPDFKELPYAVLADHIHSIQPNCLVINHSCRADLAYTQVVHYEATHGQHIPYDNTFPSQQGPVLQPTWFWEKGYEKLDLKPVDEIIDELQYTNQHYSNYLLNAAPNNKGLMDDNVVKRLQEVGKKVMLSKPYKRLPKVENPHKNVAVKTSSNLIPSEIKNRNLLDLNLFTAWQAHKDDASPWIELDFGKQESFNYFSMHAGYKKTIQKYVIEALVKNKWITLYEGGIGTFHEKGAFKEVSARKYRLRVLEKKGIPEIVELTFAKH
ncbi:alpha-L-fucosidase [Ochrovirga pacifica]|uniref:alpha-L-fucosidase n=1 Tax=Ochrovirga pacifica TaxID=1042376 RepID=UPI0005244AF5|nr:alpha-L-fucosidase [Ochrovirga pacifica]